MKLPYSPVRFLYFLCVRWLSNLPDNKHRPGADELQTPIVIDAACNCLVDLLEECIWTMLSLAMSSHKVDSWFWRRQSLQEDVPSRGAGPLPPCHREGCSVDCQTPAFWKRSRGPASLASRVCQCLCFTYTRICHRVPCLSKSCFPTICDDRLLHVPVVLASFSVHWNCEYSATECSPRGWPDKAST